MIVSSQSHHLHTSDHLMNHLTLKTRGDLNIDRVAFESLVDEVLSDIKRFLTVSVSKIDKGAIQTLQQYVEENIGDLCSGEVIKPSAWDSLEVHRLLTVPKKQSSLSWPLLRRRVGFG